MPSSPNPKLFHLTRIFTIAMALSTVSACSGPVSSQAVCDGTLSDRAAHAAALAEDGGDQSIRTGATLIRKLDAACGDI